jgi:uncharacterized protein
MSNSTKKVPIVDGVLSLTDKGPRLIGSKCTSCGTYFFPKSSYCNNAYCSKGEIKEVTFGTRGKVYSYTIQYYAPPAPYKWEGEFKPYAIGYIDLPEGIRVLGQLTGCKLEDVKIGMDVELVAEKQFSDAEGNEYITWKYKPV